MCDLSHQLGIINARGLSVKSYCNNTALPGEPSLTGPHHIATIEAVLDKVLLREALFLLLTRIVLQV